MAGFEDENAYFDARPAEMSSSEESQKAFSPERRASARHTPSRTSAQETVASTKKTPKVYPYFFFGFLVLVSGVLLSFAVSLFSMDGRVLTFLFFLSFFLLIIIIIISLNIIKIFARQK
jgi:hypothetical protein